MNKELREHIKEENTYSDLLKNNPQFRLQGYSMECKKVIVGVIQGDPEKYNQGRDHLNFKYFDSWKDTYTQLSK